MDDDDEEEEGVEDCGTVAGQKLVNESTKESCKEIVEVSTIYPRGDFWVLFDFFSAFYFVSA